MLDASRLILAAVTVGVVVVLAAVIVALVRLVEDAMHIIDGDGSDWWI